MRHLVAILVAALGLVAQAVAPAIYNHTDRAAMERWVDSVYSTLSERDRVAQLMMAAITPTNVDKALARVDDLVGRQRVGGIIYHESGAVVEATVTNHMRHVARVPVLVSIDGEWGLAMRLKELRDFPRNLRLGAVTDEQLLYEYGREVARQCRIMGIHIDLAPVVDVNDVADKPTLGNRAYGDSPSLVSSRAIAFSRGLEDGGVLSVAKHFPGHGATADDSHKMLPTIHKSLKQLNKCELVPFRQYINRGLGGILTAHLNVPAIDKDVAPTTFSQRCVTDLLKRDMGFEGLIITDALGMKGAADHVPAGSSAAVEAFIAGNDILLMPENVEQEIDAVMSAIAAGTISRERVEESCRKILRFKYALGLAEPQPDIELDNLVARLDTPATLALQDRLVAASITVLTNKRNLLPVRDLERQRIAVLTIGGDSAIAGNIYHDRADDYAHIAMHRHVSPSTDLAALARELKRGGYTLVLIGVNDNSQATQLVTRNLVAKVKNSVLMLTAAPYDIKNYGSALGNAAAVVLTYDDSTLARDLAVQTAFGGNAACGVLPVTVRPVGGGKTYKPGVGVHYAATRLGYAMPQMVGVDNRLINKIDSVATYAVREHAFPGCQVLVARHGKVIVNRAYGEMAYGSGERVTTSTLYDCASVSKATGTLSAVMKVYDRGGFGLDEPASLYIPGLRRDDKRDITFRDLLYHETGMPPSLSMWLMMMDTTTYSGPLITGKPDEHHHIKVMNNAWGHDDARLRSDILSSVATPQFPVAIARDLYGGTATYDAVMQGIYGARVGEKRYLYSCLNFSLLADAMQRISGERLDVFDEKNIFAPLGAWHTCYRAADKFPLGEIAPTEVDTYLRKQHVRGYVHDELSAFSLGVQGNAGLFSTAGDLAKLLQMWLNGGTYGGHRFLSESTVNTFLTAKSPNSHRGLGFDKPVIGNPDASNTCAEAGPSVIGHTGFTGTSFWVDPDNDLIYVFMSNRVSPTRNNPAFGRVSARSNIHSLIYRCLLD